MTSQRGRNRGILRWCVRSGTRRGRGCRSIGMAALSQLRRRHAHRSSQLPVHITVPPPSKPAWPARGKQLLLATLQVAVPATAMHTAKVLALAPIQRATATTSCKQPAIATCTRTMPAAWPVLARRRAAKHHLTALPSRGKHSAIRQRLIRSNI